MPIWKLSPIDLIDPNWEASSHRGAAIVRAENEEAARVLAQKVFGVKTGFPPGRGITAPPWKRAELVKAECYEQSLYENEGPNEVLLPSFEADLKPTPRKK